MSKGTGLFWLGKGTLGEIRQNEEIPEGAITPERMKELIKKKLIGERFKPVDDNELANLRAENAELREKLKSKNVPEEAGEKIENKNEKKKGKK